MRVQSAGMPERLKQLREARNASQSDVAKLLGVSRAAYSQWEADLTEPSLGHIEVLAILLGSTPEYIAFAVGAADGGRQGAERRERIAKALHAAHVVEDRNGPIKPLPMSVHVLTRKGLLGNYKDYLDKLR